MSPSTFIDFPDEQDPLEELLRLAATDSTVRRFVETWINEDRYVFEYMLVRLVSALLRERNLLKKNLAENVVKMPELPEMTLSYPKDIPKIPPFPFNPYFDHTKPFEYNPPTPPPDV